MSTDDRGNFVNELREKISDESLFNLVCESFSISPLKIKDKDPKELLKEAKDLENNGRIGHAVHKYREAALVAFYQRSQDLQTFWDAYAGFLGRQPKENRPMFECYSKDINAYNEIKNSDVMQILIGTYEKAVQNLIPTAKTKK